MKMPGKIIIVIALLVLAIVMDTISQLMATELTAGFVIVVSIRVLLIIGLLVGSEGARMILKAFAVAGLFLSGMGLVTLLTSGFAGQVPLATMSSILGMAVNGFVLYALQDRGVQAWMFSKSMGADALGDE